MSNQLFYATLVTIYVVCVIVSAAIKMACGVRVPVFMLSLMLFSCVASVFIAVRGFFKVVKADLYPEQAKVAKEQQRFMPLVNLANSRNGTYEVLGRAGKSVFETEIGTCTVTARAGVSDIKLVVAAAMPLEGFVFEISNAPIRRADLESFTVSDEADQDFFIGANDIALARGVIEQCFHGLLDLEEEFSLTTVRGNLELRRQLWGLDDENTAETISALESVHYAIEDLARRDAEDRADESDGQDGAE